jgi:hypothetical protein
MSLRSAVKRGEGRTRHAAIHPFSRRVLSVVILVADGVRPDTLAGAMDRGDLPALAALRTEGALETVTTAFPSVTGVAYAPFLLGRYPAPVGLPGLRWFDRAGSARTFLGRSRSYVGAEMRLVDGDLDAAAPTMFELSPSSLGALSVIARGLPGRSRLGYGAGFVARTALTHFTGNLRGWLDIDRGMADEIVRRVRSERPDFTFAAFTGVDKASHACGQDSPEVSEALGIIDDVAARIRSDAERNGTWDDLHLWVVSDHGHSPVFRHDDLAGWLRSLGLRIRAHPFVVGGTDAAVMVSGNAMAHVYLELRQRSRPFWGKLRPRWDGLLERLEARDSVDLILLPRSPEECEVRAPGRGSATLRRDGRSYWYLPRTGDPLGCGALEDVDDVEAYEATVTSDYPDAVVQIANLAGAPRSGEIILSASRGWDFRGRYEPIPHCSSHGALHREHMLVPLLVNRMPKHRPRRTVDVMPSALAALGIQEPDGLDGVSFLSVGSGIGSVSVL